MILKTLQNASIGVIFTSLASETFYNKIDRNLMRPVRNLVEVLNDDTSFVMQEDICRFAKELGRGCLNMLKFEKGF